MLRLSVITHSLTLCVKIVQNNFLWSECHFDAFCKAKSIKMTLAPKEKFQSTLFSRSEKQSVLSKKVLC